MMSLPTDRLHKFLAIGGAAAIFLGSGYAIHQYETAEMYRIQVFEKMLVAQSRLDQFGEALGRQGALLNIEIANLMTNRSNSEANAKFREQERETQKALVEAKSAAIEMQVSMQRVEHYIFMKNVSLGFALASWILGGWMTFVGFKHWIRQSSSER